MTPEELAASVARAHKRLDAGAGYKLTCPRCGHTDTVEIDPARYCYTCDECSCKIAFGEEQPDIAVNPHADRRFVCSTFATGHGAKRRDVTVTLERKYAAEYALEILSVCDPGKWRALMAMAAKSADVPGAPHRDDDITLDEGFCPCGARSEFANGSCRKCHAAALGISA